MNTYQISIMIQITPTTDSMPCGVTERPDGQFQCVIPAQAVDGDVWEAPHPYRVDGEVGRFECATHWIEPPGGCVYEPAHEGFSPLGSTERDLPQGFKALSMITEAAEKSYRTTTGTLNRFRHQAEDGTPMRTLRDQTAREGARLHDAIEQQADQILEAHHIPRSGELAQMPPGLPLPMDPTLPGETTVPNLALADALALTRDEAPAGTDLRDTPVPYESPRTTVNICIDDVGTQRQKASRTSTPAASASDASPKTVQHTVAHVEQRGRRYILAGYGVVATLRILMAVLVRNGCLGYRLQFVVDGQRSLHGAIRRCFAGTRR